MALWTEWQGHWRGYNRNVKLYFLFSLLWNIGMGAFMVIYNLYVKALGLEQGAVGHVVAMTALASAISLIPAGLLIDKFGGKKVAQYGMLVTVVALMLRSLVEAESFVIMMAFVSGLVMPTVSVMGVPFLTGNSRPEQRVPLFSMNMALVMIGNMIGNIAGGSLSDIFQFTVGFSEVFSLRLALLIGVAIAALGLVPMTMLRGGLATTEKAQQTLKEKFRDNPQSIKFVIWFAVLTLIFSSGGGLIVPYLNVYFVDRFDASKTAVGIIVSLGQAATAFAYLIGPAIERRLGEVRSVLVLQLLSIPFLLLTAFTTSFLVASCGYLARQALMNAATPFQTSLKMARVAPSLRGFANSTGDAAFNLGWFLVAPVNTYLVHTYGSYWGYANAFCLTAILYLVVTYLYYVLFKGTPIVSSQPSR